MNLFFFYFEWHRNDLDINIPHVGVDSYALYLKKYRCSVKFVNEKVFEGRSTYNLHQQQ